MITEKWGQADFFSNSVMTPSWAEGETDKCCSKDGHIHWLKEQHVTSQGLAHNSPMKNNQQEKTPRRLQGGHNSRRLQFDEGGKHTPWKSLLCSQFLTLGSPHTSLKQCTHAGVVSHDNWPQSYLCRSTKASPHMIKKNFCKKKKK